MEFAIIARYGFSGRKYSNDPVNVEGSLLRSSQTISEKLSSVDGG